MSSRCDRCHDDYIFVVAYSGNKAENQKVALDADACIRVGSLVRSHFVAFIPPRNISNHPDDAVMNGVRKTVVLPDEIDKVRRALNNAGLTILRESEGNGSV